MRNRTRISDISSLLRRVPGIREFEVLMESLPEAAVLVNIKESRILISNSKATEITAYSRDDLQKLEIKQLFKKIDETSLSNLERNITDTADVILTKKSGFQVNARIKISRLDESNQWVLIQFNPDITINNIEVDQDLLKHRWEGLHKLSRASQNIDTGTAIEQILQAGQLLTGASFLAIYQLERKESLSLKHHWGKIDALPTQLKISEISHLRVPFIWTPGNQIQSELHNRAFSADINYLATIPLNESSPQEGILVVGDQIGQPPLELPKLLKLMTGSITAFANHHNNKMALEERITKLSRQLDISHTIKNLVNDGLIFITRNHKILDINEPAAMALGYSIDEVKGNKIEEIIVGKRPITQILNTISKDEVKLHDLGDFSLHRRDGQPILINLRAIPLFYDGQSEGMAILLSDLSQHEEFRIRTKQLEQQALLGEVMAIFAHEVRNPINNISTGVQLLSSNFAADNPIQEEINRLKIDLDRLTELMKSILSFSKTKEYKIESVNIEIMIRNLMERWRLGMSRNNILPRIQCTPNIPNVKGDKRALEQVFTNIIQNALNAMKNQGGVLGIRIESAKTSGVLKMINVDVSDTGPGIPEDIRDRIFELFFTTNKYGTGLGLAITKRIVSAHNGQIKVESFPGGTVFKIKLPADINGS